MKHLIAALATLAVLVAPVLAAPKTEVGFGAEYTKFDNRGAHGGDSYSSSVTGSVLFGVGKTGWFVVGPTVGVSSDDYQNRLGVAGEFNFMGQAAVTLFAGGEWRYFVKDRDGGGQDALLLGGGVKIAVGKGAAAKIGYWQVIDGIGKDVTDQTFAGTMIARF